MRCDGGLKVPGVRFYTTGSALKNWEARLAVLRACLVIWPQRRSSLSGRIMVVKAVALPVRLHIAYVFPVPGSMKIAINRAGFKLLWYGRMENVRRELMYKL